MARWLMMPHVRALATCAGFVTLAFLLRVWPLGATGTRFAWLTFYPAVMAVAMLEGAFVGVLAAFLSVGVVWKVWPWLLGSVPLAGATGQG